jgi:hypothetical protein
MPPLVLERPFTLSDAEAAGVSRACLRAMVARGEVRRILRGVYAGTDVPDSLELRAAALHRVIAPAHVVVDRTAAWLHGVDVYAAAENEYGPVVEVCAPPQRRPTERAGVRARTRDLAPEDIMTIAGLRITTPLRTAVDLGCHLRRREAFAALCQLAALHDLTPADLQREARRLAKRRGVVQLRELCAWAEPRVESPREAWTLLAIIDAGLPAPEPQWWVLVDGVPTYRLDFAYPARRVCVEYDGDEAHGTAQQQADDRRRRQWLRDNGWIVIVVRRGDFAGDAVWRWLAELRTALQPAYTTRRW